MKLISFILPAYKRQFLQQAIDSILAQTYPHFELIIIDDDSPENLHEIVMAYQDERISYVKNETNIGGTSLVKQWNHCLQYAAGEYMVLAADDDVYHPEFLTACMTLAAKYPQVDLIRSGACQIDEANLLIGIDGIIPELCSQYQFAYYWLNATTTTCIGNYVFKTKVMKEKKFIDFPFAFGSDTASTIAMAEMGVANTAEMFFSFRISSIHLSSNKGKLKEKLEAITLLFTWLGKLRTKVPVNDIDKFCYDHIAWPHLYSKCKYDYYNLVIKFLPFSQLTAINKCSLLSRKDKWLMLARYIKDHLG